MLVKFTEKAEADFKFHLKTGNKTVLKKISNLISAIEENPFLAPARVHLVVLVFGVIIDLMSR